MMHGKEKMAQKVEGRWKKTITKIKKKPISSAKMSENGFTLNKHGSIISDFSEAKKRQKSEIQGKTLCSYD